MLSQIGWLPCLRGMHTQRIFIIGGGFAGANAAVGAVEKLGSAQDYVSVGLVNPDPYWVIKPRLRAGPVRRAGAAGRPVRATWCGPP